MATLELLNKRRLIVWSSDRSGRLTPGSAYSRDTLVTVARKPLGLSEAEDATAWCPQAVFGPSIFSVISDGRVQRRWGRELVGWEKDELAYCGLGEKGSFPTQESSRCVWLGISQLSKLFLLFPGQAPNLKCQSEAAPCWSIALTHLVALGHSGKTLFPWCHGLQLQVQVEPQGPESNQWCPVVLLWETKKLPKKGSGGRK